MLPDSFVALGGNHYDAGVTGPHLLNVADDLFIDVRSCGDGDQRGIWIEQGNGAVFQLAGREAFGMDVGDFFEFERPLEGSRETHATTNEHDTARTRHAHRERINDVIWAGGGIQYTLHLSWDALKGSEDLCYLPSRHAFALAGKIDAQQVEH